MGCHALLQGIFLTQGSNPHLLYCRQVLYPQGSPNFLPTLTLYAFSASTALVSRLILNPPGKQDSLPASPVTSSQPEPPRGSLTLHHASISLPLLQRDNILSFPGNPFPLPKHCFFTSYLLLSYLTDRLNPHLSLLEILRASK